jgi:hypothetical protein
MRTGGKLIKAHRSIDDWHGEGRRRFGIYPCYWFRCPRCGLAFTPEHAADAGVRDEQRDNRCHEALGGCGFPWYGAATLGQYRREHKAWAVDNSGMVSIAKDHDWPAFWVLPFCPDELIPEDGRPAVVGEVDQAEGGGDAEG